MAQWAQVSIPEYSVIGIDCVNNDILTSMPSSSAVNRREKVLRIHARRQYGDS